MDSQNTNLNELTLNLVPFNKGTESNRLVFANGNISPEWLSNQMQLWSHENGHPAITAPQLGFNFRVLYLYGMESAFFNPIILDKEGEISLEEYSPSFPNIKPLKIKRPQTISVAYRDAFGESHTNVYTGFTARMIQHSIDFLDGKLYYERANKYHLDKARR